MSEPSLLSGPSTTTTTTTTTTIAATARHSCHAPTTRAASDAVTAATTTTTVETAAITFGETASTHQGKGTRAHQTGTKDKSNLRFLAAGLTVLTTFS